VKSPFGIHIDQAVIDVCARLRQKGGQAYLVGGCVRDLVLRLAPKDYDIEVYNLTMDKLKSALSEIGKCQQVGKSFGVIKLWTGKHEIDVSLPRVERKIATGHKGFSVQFDPDLLPQEASSRRDFTINAMMLDPVTDELLDFHGGLDDLEEKLLRHITPAFEEDPLRVLRAMQFAARFGLSLHKDTAARCRGLLGEANSLAIERIWVEWRKWADAAFPACGLQALRDSGWVELYPEINELIGCPQDAEWHPEGDVWTHTCLVVDQAAEVADRYAWAQERRWILLFAALVHDMGKPATTYSDEQMRTRSTAHSLEGLKPAATFMQRIGAPVSISDCLPPLVKEHLTHLHGEPTERAVRRLAQRLEPVDVELWEALVEADASGRSPLPPARPGLPWLLKATEQKVHQGKPSPIVSGQLLMELGMKPGPEMGRLIHIAYEAQLDGQFSDETEAEMWCRKRLSDPV